jgi:hypothetical protein
MLNPSVLLRQITKILHYWIATWTPFPIGIPQSLLFKHTDHSENNILLLPLLQGLKQNKRNNFLHIGKHYFNLQKLLYIYLNFLLDIHFQLQY